MGWVVAIVRRCCRRDALFLGGLLLAVGIAYWPSLDHVPRADQWAYLLDTRLCRSFGELWTESYSYNRVRVVGPGDVDLFRPVLFTLLAIEKHLFGNNFWPSQAVGLVLHGTVVVLLFVLLRRVHRLGSEAGTPASHPPLAAPKIEQPPCNTRAWQVLPHAVTAFFALNFASMELVVWAHLHGYLLFLALVLTALLMLLRLGSCAPASRRADGLQLAVLWVVLALAAFTYELGQFFAVLVGLVLAGRQFGWWIKPAVARVATDDVGGFGANVRPRAWPAAAVTFACFAAILPIYQAVNRWDRHIHRERFAEEGLPEQIAAKALSFDTLEHSGRFIAFTSVQPFFPSATGWWYQGERIHIQEPVYGWVKYVRPNAKLLVSYLTAAAFVGLTVAGLWRWRTSLRHPVAPVLLLTAALYGLYLSITVLGRMNLRPSRFVLCSNSYYTYVALLFLAIMASASWQALSRASSRWRRLGVTTLAIGL
ncbi:MAG: hypothetical protein NZO58_05240, partial [Gemmataceae bacterium]|nr:hypothetical protein [Gemmataceae bacterium]